ncbi:hypothetical protein LEP1GSC035_0445 [Leptospira noguchii str. 2007001578]|uniref:Uncharacterized protein n=2 Tax=Leptospira noguchii TaxID=28182 RepID=M6Y6B4_9LEPT|nr:hypothetical protein LEP1GSC035_0445 [Leptospira noguchii str. 2007001578]EMO89255.1 hypothetical protein LEP1GSC024_4020 [Leptospira noguchii str. 2001034031]
MPLKNKMFLIFQFSYPQSEFPFKKITIRAKSGKITGAP